MNDLRKLIALLKETRTLIARDGNDFSWSSLDDQNQAMTEIDFIIAELEHGTVPGMGILLAPTGPIQEVSLSSGWGNKFLALAAQFDKEYAVVRDGS